MRRRALALAALLLAHGAAQAASLADPKATAVPAAEKKPSRELPTPYTPNYSGGAIPPATGQPPDFAYGAYQRGQYVTAFREATKRIEADPKDAAAMTLLGELYNQGLGVPQNPVKAADWYKLAAAQKDPAAMSSLGLMAMDGRGVPRDPKAGRRWLEQAASLGSPTASYNLGLILIGTGLPADEAEVAAALRGWPDARSTDLLERRQVRYVVVSTPDFDAIDRRIARRLGYRVLVHDDDAWLLVAPAPDGAPAAP